MSTKEQADICKPKVFKYGKEIGNVSKAWRYYGISTETYYK